MKDKILLVNGPPLPVDWTALHRAAWFGNIKEIRKLIKEGALIDIQDIFGNTPLHCAAHRGEEPAYELLKNSGALLIKNSLGQSPDDLWNISSYLEEYT